MEQTHTTTAMEAVPPCPACGRHDSLVVLGTRLDRAHPVLVWRTGRTFICTCTECGAVVTLRERPARQGQGQNAA